MKVSASQTVRQIFGEAMERPAGERSSYLDRACGSNAALRSEVEELLVALAAAEDFLVSPADSAENSNSSSINLPGDGTHAAHRETRAISPGHEVSGTQIGRYRLLEEIGHGGFGTVFLAEQREPVVRKVALKIINIGMDTRQVIARFEAERQALAIMDHPNIARVLDGGATETGRPYFVMELVRGEAITTYCDARKLSIKTRLELFIEVCQAVQHAHTKGIIHRDIKPSNVLVTIVDNRPVPKVIDFGIAKAISGRLTEQTVVTEFRQLIGTPAYMSPEQAQIGAFDIDTRSDVYSLGVLLYELITGMTPFDQRQLLSSDYDELRRIIRDVEPSRPSSRIAESHREKARILRGDLDWIVMKCLEKDRSRRYETANGLAADVQRCVAGEPVIAAPPSKLYRMRKFVRRHRTVVLASGALLFTLVMGIIGTTTGWRASVHSARVARKEADKARAFSTFLQEMLASANPLDESLDALPRAARLGNVARDRKVSDLLNETAEALNRGQFNDDPLTEAALRSTVGSVYGKLGLRPRAEAHLRRAYAIQQKLLGAEHRDTLTTLVALIDAIPAAPDRHALLEHALDAVPRVLGPEDRVNLLLIQVHARALMVESQWDQAVAQLQDLLALQNRLLSEGDPQTLHTMNQLADCLQELKQVPAAQKLARQAVELAAHAHGSDGAYTHLVRNGLAHVLLHGNAFQEDDLPMVQAAVDGLRRHFGEEAEITFDARIVRVGALMKLKNYEAAEQEARAVLADGIRLRGDADRITWCARGLLWEILDRTGRRNEATALSEQAWGLASSAINGGEPAGPLVYMIAQFDEYKVDRKPEAIRVARQALALIGAYPNQAEAGAAANEWRTRLVYILTEVGQLGEAEAVARQQIDYLRQARGPTHRDLLQALNGLAWTMFQAGRFAEGEPLAREAVEGHRRAQHSDVLDRINTFDTLGMTLCRLNRPAEAEPLFREISELLATGTPPDFFVGDSGMHALHFGECLLLQKKYPESERRLLEALQAASAVSADQARETAQTARERLVELYETQGSPEKAAPYRSMSDAGTARNSTGENAP